ncbi:uncharacterized protein BX664DRAFT_378286 [Halteromyces radiatus]|uniref:uncharacterized protein n=1 Tax=Halteromyces radiatus TaxID=101107 RepID=UPI002220B50E|nr:uncharacterized protein BX664DRAFT_378286 [Halteromyces radiatus]KAI8097578.1 hypothetical protein BX664DRAFT_378286 [Halteromyces radiatus]
MLSPSHDSTFYEHTAPTRQWSIRQANSRLYSRGLESALESDLTLQQMEEKNSPVIPLNHLDSNKNLDRHSNNPYKSFTSQEQHQSIGYGFQQDPFAVSPMEAWQEMKDYNLQVNGIPTLDQLLRLPTSSPITQTQFSSFLRRRGAQQNLNFLLQLETHQRLWQAYLNSVERQQRPEMKSDRSSKLLSQQTQWSPTTDYFETPDTMDLLQSIQGSHTHLPSANQTYASRTLHEDKSLSRHDVVQNAIRIYRTFCSRYDAAQLIHLPDDHRAALETLVETNQRPEPVIFDAARSHVFDVLNMFYYPQFVDAVLYTNVSTWSSRLFLVIGLVLLTFGLALEFAFIFLDAGNTGTRSWAFLPFLFSWAGLLTGVTHFAWWSAWLKRSETSFMVFVPVEDKTVIKIHQKRAFIFCVANVLIAFVNTIIFVFIPAHRL